MEIIPGKGFYLTTADAVAFLATADTLFLTADEIPPNKLIRVGDHVRIPYNRRIERVGYKLHADDVHTNAFELATKLGARLTELTNTNVDAATFGILRKAADQQALKMINFGGPHRGIHLKGPRDSQYLYRDKVDSLRYVLLGTRVSTPDERPFLINRRRVLLVSVNGHEFLSSDCEVINTQAEEE